MIRAKTISEYSFLGIIVHALSLVLLLFSSGRLPAQLQNSNWYFGDSAGIRFVNDTIIHLNDGALTSDEACASISSQNGDLLFYTNGLMVWGRNHLIMPNGSGLLAGQQWLPEYGSTITNGVTIIPDPGDENQYVIFTIGGNTNLGINYSKVNLALNPPFGDIGPIKNVHLLGDTTSEKLGAIRHGNGRDWWILANAGRLPSNGMYIILANPWEITIWDTSYCSPPYPGFWPMIISGEITISNDGTKIAHATSHGIIELFSFDRCSGSLNFLEQLGEPNQINPDPFYYGCAFSSDGTKLYVSTFDSLFQYNLSAANVKESKTFIWEPNNPEIVIGQMQLGLNGRLYVSTAYNMGFSDTIILENQHVSCVLYPDSLGSACAFNEYQISLGNHRSYLGLPNNPNYALGPLVGSACDTLGLSNDKPVIPSLKVIPNPSSGKFKIELPEPAACERIRVIDVAGRKVWDQVTPGIMKELEMDLVQLAEGTYYVEIECLDGKVLRSKFMIQR